MKLPAVAIAASFLSGVILGLHPFLTHRATSAPFLRLITVCSFCLIITGMWLANSQRLVASSTAAIASWITLGVLAAGISSQPVPPDHVVVLAENGRISRHLPLKWHGRLRDEPARLPWGYGYEIELDGVASEGALRSARGRLRLTFTPHPGDQALPDLHAGIRSLSWCRQGVLKSLRMMGHSIGERTWRCKTSIWSRPSALPN